MEVDYKAIGQRIKIARIKKGVTQETVADLIDITPAHMSNVENRKNKSQFANLDCDCQCTSFWHQSILFYAIMSLLEIVFEKQNVSFFQTVMKDEVCF